MGLIVTCGVIDKYIISAIIPGLVSFLYMPIKGNIKINDYPLLLCISSSLSLCLFIIPFLILKKRSKRKPIEHQKIMDEAFKKYKKKRCKRFVLLIILAILDIIIDIIFYFYLNGKGKFSHYTFDIIIINFISYYLLKIKLYKHHYLCIIIIAFLDITLNIIYYINCNDTFIYILIDYTNELNICFSICLIKYIMDKNYTSPFEICFYEGFFGLILNFIIFGIFVYIDNKYLNECIKYFNNFDLNELFLLFGSTFLTFIYNLDIYISIKRYNPNYIIILFIIQQAINTLTDVRNWKLYTNIILAIMSIFIFLIYNEIIEINCCGLEKNTKRNIRKRAQIDARKDDNYYDNNERFESKIEIDGFLIEIEDYGLNESIL